MRFSIHRFLIKIKRAFAKPKAWKITLAFEDAALARTWPAANLAVLARIELVRFNWLREEGWVRADIMILAGRPDFERLLEVVSADARVRVVSNGPARIIPFRHRPTPGGARRAIHSMLKDEPRRRRRNY